MEGEKRIMEKSKGNDRSERSIVKSITAWLRSNGHYVRKNHGNMYGHAGRPDLEVVCNGRFLAIEVKRPGGKMTPRQEAERDAILAAGGLFVLAHSVNDISEIAASLRWGTRLHADRDCSHLFSVG